jgi:hypothetical protein
MLHLQVVGAAGLGSTLTIAFGPEVSVAEVQHHVVTLALLLTGLIDRPLEDLIALAMLLLAALIPLQQWLHWEH